MASVLGMETGIGMPSWDFFGGTAGWTITIIAVMVMFLIGGAVVFWLMYSWRVFKYKIVVFENLGGRGFQPVFRDRARLIKLGDGGEEILFLKKNKIYRTAYGKKMGKNTFWFAIGQDGYWYNIVLGDVDAKMGMLDIEPIDRDMRYAHVAIRKNISDRYKSKKLVTAASIVVGGIIVTVIIMLIGNWFILSKIGDIMTSSAQTVEAAQKVLDSTQGVIASLNNVVGGSGVKPA